MDPTAQDQNPNQPQKQDSQIQPGQYVVAGTDDGVFKEPPAPNPFPTQPPQTPLSKPPPDQTPPPPSFIKPPQQPTPTPPLPSPPPSPQGFNLGHAGPVPGIQPDDTLANHKPNEPSPQVPPLPPLATMNAAQPATPDPTPYAPPGNQSQPPQEGPSKIKNFRMIAIIGAGALLVAIVGALVWFFLLGNKNSQPAPTATTNQTNVQEPILPPANPSSGFASLPQASQSATKSAATSSPSPKK